MRLRDDGVVVGAGVEAHAAAAGDAAVLDHLVVPDGDVGVARVHVGRAHGDAAAVAALVALDLVGADLEVVDLVVHVDAAAALGPLDEETVDEGALVSGSGRGEGDAPVAGGDVPDDHEPGRLVGRVGIGPGRAEEGTHLLVPEVQAVRVAGLGVDDGGFAGSLELDGLVDDGVLVVGAGGHQDEVARAGGIDGVLDGRRRVGGRGDPPDARGALGGGEHVEGDPGGGGAQGVPAGDHDRPRGDARGHGGGDGEVAPVGGVHDGEVHPSHGDLAESGRVGTEAVIPVHRGDVPGVRRRAGEGGVVLGVRHRHRTGGGDRDDIPVGGAVADHGAARGAVHRGDLGRSRRGFDVHGRVGIAHEGAHGDDGGVQVGGGPGRVLEGPADLGVVGVVAGIRDPRGIGIPGDRRHQGVVEADRDEVRGDARGGHDILGEGGGEEGAVGPVLVRVDAQDLVARPILEGARNPGGRRLLPEDGAGGVELRREVVVHEADAARGLGDLREGPVVRRGVEPVRNLDLPEVAEGAGLAREGGLDSREERQFGGDHEGASPRQDARQAVRGVRAHVGLGAHADRRDDAGTRHVLVPEVHVLVFLFQDQVSGRCDRLDDVVAAIEGHLGPRPGDPLREVRGEGVAPVEDAVANLVPGPVVVEAGRRGAAREVGENLVAVGGRAVVPTVGGGGLHRVPGVEDASRPL